MFVHQLMTKVDGDQVSEYSTRRSHYYTQQLLGIVWSICLMCNCLVYKSLYWFVHLVYIFVHLYPLLFFK
jgi:hypothetical protein